MERTIMKNKSEEESVWESYEKLYQDLKEDSETVKKVVNCFSAYMSQADTAYHYNKTYLTGYSEEFWKFLCCFAKKYPIVKTLFLQVEQKKNATLKIDRYWQIETETEWSGRRITCLGDTERVCSDKMLIECSFLCNTKRYVYHEILDMGNQLAKKRWDIMNSFQTFLEIDSQAKIKEHTDEKQ